MMMTADKFIVRRNSPSAYAHINAEFSVRFIHMQGSSDDKSSCAPMSTVGEIHQLRDQLEQQALQTRQALSQLMLVREQLISETNARIEAQVSSSTPKNLFGHFLISIFSADQF